MGKAKIGAVIALEGEKKFNEAVSSTEKELKKLKSESQLLKEQFKGQENSMEALRAKHDLLRRTLEAHEKKTEELNNGLQHAREVYQKAGEKLEKLEQIYNQARERMEEMENSSDTTAEALEEQRKEVERLQNNLEKSRDKYRVAEERITRWETRLNSARAEMIRTNNALRETESELEAVQQGAGECADGMGELAQEAQEAGDSAKGMGEVFAGSLAASAVEALTEKVVELGKAAVETAKEMQAAQQQVTASTGATAAEAEKYGEIMRELYGSNYGESFEDISEAMGAVKQSLGEISEVELKNVTEDAITLRDTFGMEYQEQIRAVKMLMDTFGVSSKEAYSLIAQGAQNGLDKNDDLLDTINEYSVHYKNMGVSAEGFFNSIENGTAAGTFSVDKLGDAYKEFGIRVKDTADSTTEGFELLGLDADNMREKFAAGGETAKAATDEVLQALFSMDDQVVQNQAGVDLFGTMWEDLGADAVEALMNVNGEMSTAKNTMDSIKDIKYSDMGSQIAEVAREIEMKLVEPIEKKWLPVVKDGLEVVSDNIDIISTGTIGLAGAAGLWKASHTKAGEAVVKALKSVIFTKGADAAATGAQTAATGAHTVATKAATAAQTAFNVVLNMNPIAKIVIALAAGVAAYKAITKAVINSDKELKENRETVEELCQEMDELKQSTEDAREAREESLEGIQAEYGAYEVTAEKLIALSEQENKTNGQKALMKTYVDQLNEAMPELNLAIDEQTGKLNMNEKSIKAVIEAEKEKALLEAKENMMGEILQEQMKAEIELAKIQEQRDQVIKKQNDLNDENAKSIEKVNKELEKTGSATLPAEGATASYTVKMKECDDQLKDLDEKMKEAQKTADEASDEYDLMAEAVANVAEKNGIAAESTHENSVDAERAAKKVSEAYAEMEEGIRKSLEGTADIFDEFNAGQELSTEEMLRNLDSQEEGLTEWRDNLKILAGAAGQGMTEEFFQYLVQMGPQGANAVAELSAAFQNGEPEFKEICDKYKKVLELEGETSEEIASTYYDTGINSARGMKQGIEDGTEEAEQAARTLATRVMNAGRVTLQINSPSRKMRDEVGVWIPRGLAKGIEGTTPEAEKAARKMAKDTVSAAKNELEINSPSKKFEKLSKTMYQRAKEGLKNIKKNHNLSAQEEQQYWKNMLNIVKKGTEDYQKVKKKVEELNLPAAMERKGNFGVSKKTEDGKKKSDARYSNEVMEAAENWFSSYKNQHDTTVKDEVVFWEKIRKQLKKGTAAYREATKNIKDAKKAVDQEKLTASDKALSQYKTYYKVSAQAEVDYWNIVRKQFKKGTDERIEADQKYFEAKGNLNSQLESQNEEYAQNCKDVQERLKDDIESLTEEYNSAVEERAESIYSSFGLFDKFQSKSESGATLLYNLKTQVAGYADWELMLEKLEKRGVSEGLLEELKEMGPEASASLHALNTLTDEQLKEYEQLWKQKKDLSKSQAVKDMEPMRKETEAEIKKLTDEAKKEIKGYKEEYNAAVKELTEGISSALKKVAKSTEKIGEDATAKMVAGIKEGAEKKSTKADIEKANTKISNGLSKLPKAGKTIGKNTLEGILDGLNNKKEIQKSAKQFIEELKKEIQKAAEIKSPSRLFKREIGLQLPAGIGEGIEEGTEGVKKKGTGMIKSLLDSYKEELKEQEKSLQESEYRISAVGGIETVNRLVSVPVQQNTSVTVDNGGVMEVMGEILNIMQQYVPQMAEKQIVLDSGEMVGALSSGISAEFAMMNRRNMR